ncbi:MAG: hypothetical protein KME35_00695 [Aphanocapsa sp. GSE-SYN-MK-11-07L]|nr:hypothetical protein [Aphanocapsa sp. GSE-SYN-MK-11-07L]
MGKAQDGGIKASPKLIAKENAVSQPYGHHRAGAMTIKTIEVMATISPTGEIVWLTSAPGSADLPDCGTGDPFEATFLGMSALTF